MSNVNGIQSPAKGVFVRDTGSPRGEPNWWIVTLDGELVFEKKGQEAAMRACEEVAENLRKALAWHDRLLMESVK